MIARLEAEESLALLDTLLVSGQRAVSDSEHRGHTRRLENLIRGRQAPRHRAPKITAASAARFGIQAAPEKEVNTTE